jgi:molybdenum cofactor cytidylyltransferase
MNLVMQANQSEPPTLSAVVLAAGASRRMGQPKMLLPWGDSTVIGKVIDTLLAGEIHRPIVVTGRSAQEVRLCLSGRPVGWAHNPEFERSEMLQSLQIGIPFLPTTAAAFLVVLGDQPQIESEIVRQLVDEFWKNKPALIIPSYQFKRGHPWMVRRDLWLELLSLPVQASLRDFLNAHSQDIYYLNVQTPSVLMDLDTPEDYACQKPNG